MEPEAVHQTVEVVRRMAAVERVLERGLQTASLRGPERQMAVLRKVAEAVPVPEPVQQMAWEPVLGWQMVAVLEPVR